MDSEYYKLLMDTADGQLPILSILTFALTHDSQVAIPLAETSSASSHAGAWEPEIH